MTRDDARVDQDKIEGNGDNSHTQKRVETTRNAFLSQTIDRDKTRDDDAQSGQAPDSCFGPSLPEGGRRPSQAQGQAWGCFEMTRHIEIGALKTTTRNRCV